MFVSSGITILVLGASALVGSLLLPVLMKGCLYWRWSECGRWQRST